MATKHSYTKKNYVSLYSAIKRSKISKHGTVASVLLDVFIERRGRIIAGEIVAKGICSEGEFSRWRSDMISKGWLEWSANQSDKGQYFAGKKLVKYINRELQESKQLATIDQIEDLNNRKAEKSDIEALLLQINQMKKWIDELSFASEPPDSKMKRLKRAEATKHLSVLAGGNRQK